MFDQIRTRLSRWRLYRETSRKLGELDDYLLADLGFIRSEIPSLARAAAALRRGR